MRTVVFDLDGTLADTSRDLIAAANACFEGLGHGALLDPAADAGTALKGGRAMLALGFSRVDASYSDTDIDAQYPILLDAYEDGIDTHTVLYPGATIAIEALRRDGYALAVCTNKPERLAEILLRRLGARDLFGALVGADTLPVRKPDAAPFFAAVERAGGDARRSVLVGDTETDQRTATAAGVPAILVSFGPNGKETEALAPAALMAHYDELPGIVHRLIG